MDHKNSKLNQSRRTFLKTSACALSVLPALAVIKNQAWAQMPQTPVDEASVVAAALGYKHDNTKVDAAKFPKHQAGQSCASCAFFTAAGIKLDGQAGDWGKCTIFPQNLVNSSGWCNTYTAKPK